ncbi:MAG: hypothetical protein ACNA8L_09185 [Luteolibacter sp.]
MAKHTQTTDELPPGHVRLPVALMGSMGMALAAGLQVFGFLGLIDERLAHLLVVNPATLAPAITPATVWIATAMVAYGLAWVVLEIPGNWRRIVIWISTMVVIAAWLPVAAISHTQAPVAAPLVAAAWAGLCTIIYAARHHMEADDAPAPPAPRAAEETPDSESTHAPD